jgi:hypothetical protein
MRELLVSGFWGKTKNQITIGFSYFKTWKTLLFVKEKSANHRQWFGLFHIFENPWYTYTQKLGIWLFDNYGYDPEELQVWEFELSMLLPTINLNECGAPGPVGCR